MICQRFKNGPGVLHLDFELCFYFILFFRAYEAQQKKSNVPVFGQQAFRALFPHIFRVFCISLMWKYVLFITSMSILYCVMLDIKLSNTSDALGVFFFLCQFVHFCEPHQRLDVPEWSCLGILIRSPVCFSSVQWCVFFWFVVIIVCFNKLNQVLLIPNIRALFPFNCWHSINWLILHSSFIDRTRFQQQCIILVQWCVMRVA